MDLLNSTEQLYFISLILILGYFLVIPFFSRDYSLMFAPPTILSAIFLYYAVLGPYNLLAEGGTYFKLVEHRSFFEGAWRSTLIALIGFILGYKFTSKPFKISIARQVSGEDYAKYGRYLFLIGFGMFMVFAGTGLISFLNPFQDIVEETGYSGSFSNYFLLSINLFIPALCLLVIGYRYKTVRLWLLVTLILVASSIYVSFGFRYRVVLLAISVSTTYFLVKGKRPALFPTLIAIVAGLVLMGFIGATRNYYSGLSLGRAEDKTIVDFFWAGFEDSKIFMTSGMIIDRIPDVKDYIYIDPLVETLAIPIPRTLWPGKPSGEHIQYVYELYFAKNSEVATGAAWLLFAEFHLMFGWLGVMVGFIILGIHLKKIYLWYQLHFDNPIAIVCYSVVIGSLYFVLSRGYLPQHLMLFFFTMYPAFVINNILKKKAPSL